MFQVGADVVEGRRVDRREVEPSWLIRVVEQGSALFEITEFFR